jgi:hypothetical protein
MARRTQRPPTAGANHLEWLRLVEVSGPFLSLPVLKEALPQGLEADDRDVRAELKAAHAEWNEHWHDRAYHTQWIRFVLARALEYGPEVLVDGPALPAKLRVRAALHNETLQPDYAVLGLADQGERPARLVIQVHEPGTDLERALDGARWKASPLTRMVELLRGSSDSGLSLGLVTNGEQWVLVSAPRKGTTTFVTWHASLWFEEKITLQSFRTLLGVRRTLGAADDTLERLIERSAEHQHDVTIQLGLQVREAIELLVRRIDELDRRSNRAVLTGVSEKHVYEAAVTVMMRLVFVFYLEEQADLYFPVAKSTFYQRHYALSPLGATLRAEADRLGPDVLERRSSAWCRLLACFRAIHGGVVHEDMRLPAYGGHLFDPNRFPFLEGRKPGESWRTVQSSPLGVDDATVLFVLEALQVLRVRDTGANGAETRRLSFRELGVEQIGNVYESLLDHTAKRATDAVVSLKGLKGEEPEIELRELEQCYDAGDPSKLVSFVKEKTGRSEPSITKDLEYEIEDDSARWLVACGNDRELYGRVKPVAGLVREDRRQQPAVYPKDSVYVTAGADRRSTGTHYTPPSLTEPIAQHTLEPMVYEGPAEGLEQAEWKLRSPKYILNLKVCDLACGSGAFLVQACRYLSERLVESWQALEEANPGRLIVSPLGELSEGRSDERVIPKDASERRAIARRAVVNRCIYGVDLNPAAVEMAKLSLWLITLQRDRPFTFLDHAVKSGDSLLGVTLVRQVEDFSLRPGSRQETFATSDLLRSIADASAKRRSLEELPSDDNAQIGIKRRLHVEAEGATTRVRLLADMLVALELHDLDGDSYDRERSLVAERASASIRKSISEFERDVQQAIGDRRPFHWPLEFPEVFEQGGFDAIVGNPPYRHGSRISTDNGTDYLRYLVRHTSGVKGTSDLVVYFLRRSALLMREPAACGLVTTKSIAEGDNKKAGLGWLLAHTPLTIFHATRVMPWPGTADLLVSIVHLFNGPWNGGRVLDGKVTAVIGETLEATESSADLHALNANEGLCYKGSELLGDGFIISESEARQLLKASPRATDVVKQLVNGKEFSSMPSFEPIRWVIDFGEMTELEAREYGRPFAIVEQRVKPERESDNRPARRERYWRFGEIAKGLYSKLDSCERAIARLFTCEYWFWDYITPGPVFTNGLVIVIDGSAARFAVLTSSFHEVWAGLEASSLVTRFRYTPSRCFETFPFPTATSRVGEVGALYQEARREIMLANQEGLTKTYSRFHDARDKSAGVDRLRELHMQLDREVAATYGWGSLELNHDFHETKQGVRYTISGTARSLVLDGLLGLNRQRYGDELKAGMHDKQASPSKRTRRSKQGNAVSPQGDLTFESGIHEGGDSHGR